MMSADIVWNDAKVSRSDRIRRLGYNNKVVWLTGLSGSGKSTIAQELSLQLHERGFLNYVLDGDNVRHGLNSDLGFSPEDRKENIRRVSEVAKLFYDAGVTVIVSFISPYLEDRDYVRSLIGEDFVEVFVDTPIEVCEMRDTKGLYKKAKSGMMKDFTGVDAPYEAPIDPEVALDAADMTVKDCVVKIMDVLGADVELAKKAAKRAGKAIMSIYKTKDYATESKQDSSPVTIADMEAEKHINRMLSKTDYRILSEESEDDMSRLDSSRVWIVDPLDGTKEFISGNGEFTVNIALVEDGVPILGVVYAPAIDELYVAQKGIGSFLNGKQVSVSDRYDLKELRLLKSRSHADPKMASIEEHFLSSVSRGSSLKGCSVASGEGDVYIRLGNVHEWDICAMHCVVEEAGGKMTYADGSPLRYNNEDTLVKGGFLVSNSRAHDSILNLINGLG